MVRALIKWIALYLPIHGSPDIETPPEVDLAIAGTKPVEFERATNATLKC